MIPDETLDRWQREAHERMASGFQSRVPALIAEVRDLRAERDEWRDVSVGPAYATLLREQAQTAEAELARIRALLADEHTVETVAEALGRHREDSTYPDSCVCEHAIPDRPNGRHYPAHAARAALAALAGPIGGEGA